MDKSPPNEKKIIHSATNPLWKSLKKLAELDLEREAILSEARKIELKIEEDQHILPELEKTIDNIKRAVIDAQKNVDIQELNTEQLSAQEKEKRKVLDMVKKSKEYEAVEKELLAIRKQLSEQDDILVQAWHTLEAAKKKETEEVAKLQEKIDLFKKDVAEKEKSMAEIKEKYKLFEEKRIEHTNVIPEEWLEQYEKMRNKVGDPIVPLINTSCSSCYYSIPPQDVTRLKRNAILRCRSCYRLLYYNKEEEQDLAEASY